VRDRAGGGDPLVVPCSFSRTWAWISWSLSRVVDDIEVTGLPGKPMPVGWHDNRDVVDPGDEPTYSCSA
jgi:hypothetical protein